MSYWAIIVIFNLVTAVPALGPTLIPAILGSDTPSEFSLGRIFELHFILALLSISSIFVHLTGIHRSDPGIQDDSYSSASLADVIIKDVFLLAAVIAVSEHYIARNLLHPDY
jgi:quinol-cytochrome oxidoreductase complex cytochrome b subunit